MIDKIKEALEGPINDAGFILDSVSYEKENNNNFLRIIIDKKDEYITINDCVLVNDLVDPILDKIDFINESYIVDISSKEKGCE